MEDEFEQATPEQVAHDTDGMVGSDDIRTGFISGRTFRNRPVEYAVVGDLCIVEGDCIIATVEQMERTTALIQSAAEGDSEVQRGVGITGDKYRWPNALMPYTINGSLPNKSRVTDAVAHWEAKTNMRFVERTSANASTYPNYVEVVRGTGCRSWVGMQGGRQDLTLGDDCSLGNAIHEFGHAWGLWHEQSREDRDSFVTIHWANIDPTKVSNFNQHISDGDDIGSYDYGSIMHYGRYAFSKNSQPTITPKQSGATIGQRSGLSAGDIAAVHHMYRTMHYNLTVAQVYATTHAKNAWAYFSGHGWRKVNASTNSGVTNTFALCAVARANNRKVHALMDGTTIYNVYET